MDLIEMVNRCRSAKDVTFALRMLDEILREVLPLLRMYVVRRCPPDPHLIEDIMQVIAETISSRIDSFEGNSTGEFWGWCYRIAQNKMVDHLKDPERTRFLPWDPAELWKVIEASADDAPISYVERERLERARKALSSVSPECLDILEQYYIHCVRHKDVGAKLGTSEEAARKRTKRCLDEARAEFRKLTKSDA